MSVAQNAKQSTFCNRRRGVALALGLVAATTASSLSRTAYAQEPRLFEHVDLSTADLPDDQAELLARIREQSTTAGVTLARVRPEALSAPSIELNLSAEEVLQADTTSIEDVEGKRSVTATLPLGSAVLRLDEDSGDVSGTIRSGAQVWSVRPLGVGRLHAIVEINQEQFPDDDPPGFEEIERERKSDLGSYLLERTELEEAEPVIDVLVAYTPAVASSASSIALDVDDLITNSVDETNVVYEASGINTRLNLVHTHQVNYVETSPGNDDAYWLELADLQSNADGRMDEVHTLRNDYGADVVVLLIDNSRLCGLAGDILAQPETAFAVVWYQCSASNLTFAHEVGHLQGARHNPERDGSTMPFAHGHGYANASADWRTVMAYKCPPPSPAGPGQCPKVPRFSNPDVMWPEGDGIPTGTSALHNNARVINETGALIAGFRPAVTESAQAAVQSVGGSEDAALTAEEQAAMAEPQAGEVPSLSAKLSKRAAEAHQRFLESRREDPERLDVPEMRRVVAATINGEVIDDDGIWGDPERGEIAGSVSVFLHEFEAQKDISFVGFAGDEVRAEVKAILTVDANGTVYVDNTARLYEGDDSWTDDLDGEIKEEIDFSVGKDSSNAIDITICNWAEGNDNACDIDHAVMNLVITNTSFPGEEVVARTSASARNALYSRW